MGLNDVYSQAPWTPASQTLDQMNTGLNTLGQLPARRAQVAGMEQANKDAAFTSPAAQATPERQRIGEWLKAQYMGTPGYQPGFEERLQQEFGQATPMSQGQYMPDGNMVQQVPQHIQAPPQYGSYNPEASLGMMPQQERPIQVNTGAMAGQGGEPVAPMVRVAHETGRRTPLPAHHQVAMERNAPPPMPAGPTTPMTNYDVDSLMKLYNPYARTMLRDDPRERIANAKLEWEKEKFAQLLPLRQAALQAKRDIAEMMARVRMATSDVDRKAVIEMLKIKMSELNNIRSNKARMLSGIGGVVNRPETAEMLNSLGQEEQQEATEFADLERQLRELENVRPGLSHAPAPSGGKKTSTDVVVKNKGPANRKVGDIVDIGGGKKGRIVGWNEQLKKWDVEAL